MKNTTNIIAYILGTIAIALFWVSSGVKDSADWWNDIKFMVISGVILMIIAIILYNIQRINLIVFPAVFCIFAWGYVHHILHNKYAHAAYEVYLSINKSYTDLFDFVQMRYQRLLMEEGTKRGTK
jgi:hypothetical protein